MFEASAEAICKGTKVEELVKAFDRPMVVLEIEPPFSGLSSMSTRL